MPLPYICTIKELFMAAEVVVENRRDWSTLISLSVASIVILLLLLIGMPPIRNWIILRRPYGELVWIKANRDQCVAWTDWSRVVLEILLGILISNQIFNEPFRKWYESFAPVLRNVLEFLGRYFSDSDIKRLKNDLLELWSFILLKKNLRQLPADLIQLGSILWRWMESMSSLLGSLFIRYALMNILFAFSGRFHATTACLIFIGILLTKVIKLYLDSPLLK